MSLPRDSHGSFGREKSCGDLSFINLEFAVSHLKEELCEVERIKEATLQDNQRLKEELAITTKELRLAKCELVQKCQEIKSLIRQIEQARCENRKIGQELAIRDSELGSMMDLVRNKNAEIKEMESKNHCLQSQLNQLTFKMESLEKRNCELENELSFKCSLVAKQDQHICELSNRLSTSESKLAEESELRKCAEQDAEVLKDLVSTLESQKVKSRRNSKDRDCESAQLRNEVRRLMEEANHLREESEQGRIIIDSLEKNLSSSRQETLELKIVNKELQAELRKFERKVRVVGCGYDVQDCVLKKYESRSKDQGNFKGNNACARSPSCCEPKCKKIGGSPMPCTSQSTCERVNRIETTSPYVSLRPRKRSPSRRSVPARSPDTHSFWTDVPQTSTPRWRPLPEMHGS